jgi:hypothetical protein
MKPLPPSVLDDLLPGVALWLARAFADARDLEEGEEREEVLNRIAVVAARRLVLWEFNSSGIERTVEFLGSVLTTERERRRFCGQGRLLLARLVQLDPVSFVPTPAMLARVIADGECRRRRGSP